MAAVLLIAWDQHSPFRFLLESTDFSRETSKSWWKGLDPSVYPAFFTGGGTVPCRSIAEGTGKGNVVRSRAVSTPNLMSKLHTGIEVSPHLRVFFTEELVVAEDSSFLQEILSSF